MGKLKEVFQLLGRVSIHLDAESGLGDTQPGELEQCIITRDPLLEQRTYRNG
jgi:hypothetical protein